MRITEYERGYRDALRATVTWLHAEANRMNDQKAKSLLNGAADLAGKVLQTEKAKARTRAHARPCKGNAGLPDLLTPILKKEASEKAMRADMPRIVIGWSPETGTTVSFENMPADWSAKRTSPTLKKP
jgi:hypothetical protein